MPTPTANEWADMPEPIGESDGVRLYLGDRLEVRRAIERLLMRFLRHRAWIVFWLDEEPRHCTGVRWLDLYQQNAK